ncbi:hypothetical protein [Sulfitobacter sp.]|uniref:hypothetical protein n=1 Tax=Sulfitobacter sp. TaxID=1903071 RepID=UPI003002D799
MNDQITDPDFRAAITRRVLMATLQPISTYMNAIRERVSIIQRACGRSARNGLSYINAAAYSPRMLIALMNIWRVHYNFFDWRTYQPPVDSAEESGLEGVGGGNMKPRMRQLVVLGTNQKYLSLFGAQLNQNVPHLRCGWACSLRQRQESGPLTKQL